MYYALHFAHCQLFTSALCADAAGQAAGDATRPTSRRSSCAMMNATFHRMLGILALLGLLALGLGLSAATEPAAVVTMSNDLKFAPATVTVQRGETVEWRNTSLIAHTVTADPAKATLAESTLLPDGAAPFDSGIMAPEATFRHTFAVPGTYRYFCVPHEGAKMRGTVIVE